LAPATALGNYAITYGTANFTINKATASVTPAAASKTYGAADPTLTGTLTGFAAADNVAATYGRAAGETVTGGPYTISASLAPATALGNYAITYNTASFTINKLAASVTPAAASKTYGAADPTLTGTLNGFLAADNITASYSRIAGETVTGGPYTISASLAPATALGNYAIAYNTASFTIDKLAASVTPAAASKTYGTADPSLSGTLSGFVTADNVTATYSRAAGETVAGGPYAISANLSPAGVLGNYTITYGTAGFTINMANPTVVWATPAAINYGTPLGAAQLNATSSVAGTFSYTPAPGTILKAGPQALSTTFTPTDATDYSTATISASLTVDPAAPTISWATPTAITYGTALSATQLAATASVPGTFVYNPAAGAIPPVGNDTLSVQFTPTDSTDYSPATATVTLAVSNPVAVIASLSPAFASAGGAAFNLNASGQGFAPTSIVYWGSTALVTQYLSATRLTAQVPASAIATAGTPSITVQTPAPGGGTSNLMQFEIDSAGSGTTPPTITTVTATVTPGSAAAYPVTMPSSTTDVSVSCLNLPTGASCSYSSTTNAVTIATSATTPAGTYQITVVFAETLPESASAFILLPILLIPLLFSRRKLVARGIWMTASLGLVLMAALWFNIGCGGKRGGSTPPPQTHQVTSSGVVTLTVQ
jgi:hypothetical protein